MGRVGKGSTGLMGKGVKRGNENGKGRRGKRRGRKGMIGGTERKEGGGKGRAGGAFLQINIYDYTPDIILIINITFT